MPRKQREVKIVTLDTETIGLDGPLKRIAIYDGGSAPLYGHTFKDVEWKLIEWYKEGFMPHLYIHNADFDLRKTPEIFAKGNVLWNTTKKIGNKYARLTCRHYTIHDSFKIFPSSLAKLSKDFDLEHGKLDLWQAVQDRYPGEYTDHVDFLNRCDPDDPLYLEYLGYDVISLYELLQKMMEIAKLAPEEFVRIMSTASLSRYLFKNGYGGEQFITEGRQKTDFDLLCSCKAWGSEKTMQHSNISYVECELKIREAFYGGRTEVFTPICPGGYHYDVNSLYPAAMIDNEFPIGYPEYIHKPNIAAIRWRDWLKYRKGLGFVKADVYVPPQTIPPLPSKMGKLAFVTGYISGSWTYNELAYAVEKCGVEVLHVHEVIHFEKTFKVFHNFVRTFYELKEQGSREGNASLRTMAKLVLNTAYGWTVLNRFDKTALRDLKMLDKWKDSGRILYVNEDLGMFEIWDKVTATTIQAQIGAYVTSYARLILLDALRMQAEKGTVYYCDTDSIVCSEPLPPEMVDGNRLGAWDLEAVLDSALFLQPKVYTERVKGKDSIKFKGITKSRQQQLDRDFYEEILRRLQAGEIGKMIIEVGRSSLPTLAVAQKNHKDPNKLNVMDKAMNLGAKPKRDIDYRGNGSTPWHMESLEAFQAFSFDEFRNPPSGPNLF